MAAITSIDNEIARYTLQLQRQSAKIESLLEDTESPSETETDELLGVGELSLEEAKLAKQFKMLESESETNEIRGHGALSLEEALLAKQI